MPLPRFLLICLKGWLLAGPLGWAAAQTAPPTDAALLATHHTVAILPFEATVRLPRMRDMLYPSATDTSAAHRQQVQQQLNATHQQEQLDVAYQLQALTLLQLEAQQPKHGYRVQWQPVAETNRRLQAAGISYAELARQPLSRLQQLLGVDALLTGQALLYQPLPKSLALALRVLTDEPLLNGQSVIPPGQTEASLALYDCASGRLVWQFDFGRTGANALKTTRLAPRLVKAALPSFPYCQR